MSSSGESATSVGPGPGANEITRKVQGLPGATVPLDVDGYPVAPSGLQLEQVHVYVRHGKLIIHFASRL